VVEDDGIAAIGGHESDSDHRKGCIRSCDVILSLRAA
jgi:hypothetical protein